MKGRWVKRRGGGGVFRLLLLSAGTDQKLWSRKFMVEAQEGGREGLMGKHVHYMLSLPKSLSLTTGPEQTFKLEQVWNHPKLQY